jgi:hypothetical protein
MDAPSQGLIMANTKSARPESLVLYHGTSTLRFTSIAREQRLRISPDKVALTPNFSVAEYFAMLAVYADWHDHPENASAGLVLGLDGKELKRLYEVRRFSDPIWGKGECEWEQEYACYGNIDNLDDVLLSIERVPPRRMRKLITSDKNAVHLRGDPKLMKQFRAARALNLSLSGGAPERAIHRKATRQFSAN